MKTLKPGAVLLVDDPDRPLTKAEMTRAMDAEDKARKEQIRRDYGNRAQKVAPYKPNRQQRRAQDAALRKMQKEG